MGLAAAPVEVAMTNRGTWWTRMTERGDAFSITMRLWDGVMNESRFGCSLGITSALNRD